MRKEQTIQLRWAYDGQATEEWWASLSAGEKEFIRTLMRMIKSAKRSAIREVANAARKWESGIGFLSKCGWLGGQG
jgi:hypothetical protein